MQWPTGSGSGVIVSPTYPQSFFFFLQEEQDKVVKKNDAGFINMQTCPNYFL